MPHSRPALISSLLILCVACGDDATPPDGMADGATPDGTRPVGPASFAVAAPTPPTLPTLTPCAEGWIETRDGDVTLCLPWVDAEPATCTGATFQPPGEAGCVPVGRPCPTGDFPDDVPSGNVVYMLAGGAAGGDGSRTSPVSSFAELPTLRSGDTVVLSRGTHRGFLGIPEGVTVRGACTAETVLTASAEGAYGFQVSETGVVISDLTMADLPGFAVFVLGGGEARLERVVIERASGAGITVSARSALAVSDLVVRETKADPGSGSGGSGVFVLQASTLSIDRAVIEDSRQAGAIAVGGMTALTLDRIAVSRSGAGGLIAGEGAAVRATRISVRDSVLRGIVAGDSEITCDQCFVSGTVPVLSELGDSAGVAAHADGTVTLTRSVLQGGEVQGLLAFQDGATLIVEDTLIRDIVAQEDADQQGMGGISSRGGTMILRRVAIHRTTGHALVAFSGSAMDFEDLLIDTVTASNADFGRGLTATNDSTLVAARVLVRGQAQVGVMATLGGSLSIEDLIIEPVMGVDRTQAIQVQQGGKGSFTRVAVTGWRNGVLTCVVDATCTLTDASFLDANRDGSGPARGIYVIGGSSLEATRSELVGLSSIGVYTSADSAANFVGLRISDVTTCAGECDYPGGTAVEINPGGTVTIEDFSFRDLSLCGAHVTPGASLDLRNGEVRDSAIGICVADSYDLDRLSDGVRFIDNGSNLDSPVLPTPSTPDLLGETRDN